MKLRHAARAALISMAFFGCSRAPVPAPEPVLPAPPKSGAEWEELLQRLKATSSTAEEGKTATADAHYRLGERYYQAGDFEKAIFECEKAIRIDPGHAPAKALFMEVQFLLGRARATPSSLEYERYMKESIVRHQQTLIELDNALATASRALNQGDYSGAAKELLKVQETSKWMPSGLELQARQKQAHELMRRTVENHGQRNVDEGKARYHLVEEEKARREYHGLVPPAVTGGREDLMARLADEWKKTTSGVFGNAEAPVDQLLVIEKLPPGLPKYETRGSEICVKRGDKNVPLPLKRTDVKAQISLYVAAVEVVQRYHNPYDEKIEAVYSFPLPEDAAVREFVLTVGDRRIRGIIREREEAKQIYLEARRQGVVASLLTQERPNVFTQSVANIEPGKSIDVRIAYVHALRPTAQAAYEFVFPMVVGPRFNPPGHTDGIAPVALGTGGTSGQKTEIQYLRPDEISAHDIALEVALDAGVPIEELASPSHVIRTERPDATRARVTLSPHDRIPNKDFILRYRVAAKEPKAALAAFRDGTGGYFTLVVQPPAAIADIPRSPREMVFVLDVSGSMSGQPIAAAKRALERCLKRLDPDDTFQIVLFADSASFMGPLPVPATPENVRLGLRYAESSTSGGGTMMLDGIVAALGAPNPAGRRRIVAFMTDGLIGNDPEILSEVKRRIGSARVFSFGVGSAPNRHLLEGLARIGRGLSAYVGLDDSGDLAADGLFRRIEHPAMTDLRIDWDRMVVSEVHPDPLPDLFVGQPVVLVGRFKGEGAATVTIRGRVGGRPVEMTIPVNLGDPGLRHQALASVWARSKIESLRDELASAPAGNELRSEIRKLALQHGLMSEFTSFVAVDSLTATGGAHGTTVPVAVPVPAGLRYETTVGTGGLR